MKRKLVSVMLSVFAMLLLMGAAAVQKPMAALLAEEESTVSQEMALETDAPPPGDSFAQEDADPQLPQEQSPEEQPPEEQSPEEAPPAGDPTLLINGQPSPLELNRSLQKGTTYVSLAVMSQQLDPAVKITWDGSTASVTAEGLSLSAEVGQLYVVANGRYLYVPEKVQLAPEGQVVVPLWTVTKSFGASVTYDAATGLITVTGGGQKIQSGDSFYDQDDLFWLSRIIFKESGNQSLEGQMAVGNVVLNRVADPYFPDTIKGVLAEKNQFSTYKSGALAKATPSATSTIAAKLVLDGGVVEETRGATFFDSGTKSWASRNRKHIATFGDHEFYG